MSYLNKNRKQTDLAIAFLRSDAKCVYCRKDYDLTFEFEHPFADKDDRNALIACAVCNRTKGVSSILNFLRGDVSKVEEIENRLKREFSETEVLNAIRYIAEQTVMLAYNENRTLTLSDVRFICTPNARLSELPNGLKMNLTQSELKTVSKFYDTAKLDIYIMQ